MNKFNRKVKSIWRVINYIEDKATQIVFGRNAKDNITAARSYLVFQAYLKKKHSAQI